MVTLISACKHSLAPWPLSAFLAGSPACVLNPIPRSACRPGMLPCRPNNGVIRALHLLYYTGCTIQGAKSARKLGSAAHSCTCLGDHACKLLVTQTKPGMALSRYLVPAAEGIEPKMVLGENCSPSPPQTCQVQSRGMLPLLHTDGLQTHVTCGCTFNMVKVNGAL